MRAVRLLRRAVELPGDTVIDCAVGLGNHAKAFLSKEKSVIGVDIGPKLVEHPKYVHRRGNYFSFDLKADIVFSSHTLEHVNDPGSMIRKFRDWLNPGGWLAIAVPTSLQERIHVGHLTLWTPVHLLYNLVVNGWDCRKAEWYSEDWTIGLLVQKTDDVDFSGRTAMPSEISWLNKYMPRPVVHEGNAWWDNNWPDPTGSRSTLPPTRALFEKGADRGHKE